MFKTCYKDAVNFTFNLVSLSSLICGYFTFEVIGSLKTEKNRQIPSG